VRGEVGRCEQFRIADLCDDKSLRNGIRKKLFRKQLNLIFVDISLYEITVCRRHTHIRNSENSGIRRDTSPCSIPIPFPGKDADFPKHGTFP